MVDIDGRNQSILPLVTGCCSLVFGITCVAAYLLHKQKTNKSIDEEGSGFASLVGNTKLVYIKSLSDVLGVRIYGKAEFLNPGGSVKDRVALRIMKKIFRENIDQKNNGKIVKTVYEATSGSTGISLAMAARSFGIELVTFMPDDQAREKSELITRLGGKVVFARPVSIVDPSHICKLASQAASEDPHGYFANQFENLENFQAHYYGTGIEILNQAGTLDAFVASAGTGGTIAGVAARLKRSLGNVKIILADPQGSALHNSVNMGVLFDDADREGYRVKHPFDTITEGIGLNRLTRNFQQGLPFIDHGVSVTDREAINMAYFLLYKEGLFLGSSSAVNCAGIVKAFKSNLIKKGDKVVTILCDGGMRHLSKFWSVEYLKSCELLPEYVDPTTGHVSIDKIPSPLDFVLK